ncbi:MAG: efflux RND transporter permease subunit [Rhodospirillales bacterium]
MKISDLCIRRPVFATVLNLLILLIGGVAFFSLSVREYPNIDVPTVTVTTAYKGANAQIVETQVTKPIEDSLAGIEGIDYITSISRAERSQISVVFKLDRDPDAAASDVRDRVGRARGRLPDEVDEPIIAKVEADARPILYLAFSSDRHDDLEVTDTADRLVQDRLQVLPGVAEVRIFGQRRYAMRIWLDPARLAAYGLTAQDVEDALEAQNVELPAGRVEGADRELTVQAATDLNTVRDFENIVLRNVEGYFVRLVDVASVEVGPRDERRIARFNGRNAVALGVVKQSVANPLAVTKAVRAEVPRIAELLPEGMEVQVAYDSTIFINASIDAVYKTIAEAVALVVLVIFVFLRSLRAVLIPLVTIPVSMVGAFALMAVLDFSINTLTLLAFVIAVGLVVDDAIVMLENIYRHIENGLSPIAAAFKGSREIAFAIVSVTITIAAVFVPVGFTEGRTGRLFTEFALTLSAAVIISGFIALTLSPMMCSRLLTRQTSRNVAFNLIERFFYRMELAYRSSLAFALSVRPMVLLFCAGVAVASVALYQNLNAELTPREDRGYFVGFFSGPEGATVDFMDGYARQMEAIYDTIPEAERYFVVVGFPTVSRGISFIAMEDWGERERSTAEIAGAVNGQLSGVRGLRIFAINPQSLGQSSRKRPVEVLVQTTGTYEQLEAVVEQAVLEMEQHGAFTNIDVDLKLNKPELEVTVNREKLADMGISVESIGRTLETLLGGRDVTRFERQGEQYDVVLQLAGIDRRNPDDLSRIYVRGRDGEMAQLSNLVQVSETVVARELNHFNKLRAAKIEANLAEGFAQGPALEEAKRIIEAIGGEDIQVEFGGAAREFFESSDSLVLAFGLALLFVFLVLAAQFESWVDPVIILITVPLAMVGALLALNLTGGTLNIYSQIGLIALVGLIAKNGILVVEFANKLREQKGLEVRQAALEAAALRLRPVLMTALSLIFGALPLALASGAGAESRQQIGWVIVGGMGVGTLFTLYVIPTIYSYLSAHRRFDQRRITDAEAESLAGDLDDAGQKV